MSEAIPPGDLTTRDRLGRLFDYVAQVVRLDERVAFDLKEYRLADGRPARFALADTAALPGVRHDTADEAGPVWLAVERLARTVAPVPPDDLVAWLVVSADPGRLPELQRERIVTVGAAEREARIAAGACPTSFAEVASDAAEGAESATDGAPRVATAIFRQTLCLADQPGTEARLARWIADTWEPWAAAERPRRRTIVLYERLYRLLQQRETGGAEAPIEVVWGIGMARWRYGGRILERPLIERAVDLELDEADGGLLRVRPTVADATVDLKPYEEFGCVGLDLLDAAIRRLVETAAAEDGVSPFRRTSFEPVLEVAAARLHPDAAYRPADPADPDPAASGTLAIDDTWVLFARPRSAHVLLADIDRLKAASRDPTLAVEGLATRLVTEPSDEAGEGWTPLSDTLGDSPALPDPEAPGGLATEVFFPKPFNDDQVEIVRRLARSDGLVVQGPPGTGKTHTIANLICHAMATGQRVLVVSRGEAALAVLRDQLPAKVRPLAIALLSNERQGLGQVEGAIREIQAVVEESRPEIRHAAIRRCEAEIVKLRGRLAAIDTELDTLAAAQAERIGPRAETPAELALRLAGSRAAYAWFSDRPERYLAETDLTDADLAALTAARRRIGDLIDHRDAVCPAPADLPTPQALGEWHVMLVRRADRAANGDGGTLHLLPSEAEDAVALADALDGIAHAQAGLPATSWLQPLLAGPPEPWATLLASLVDACSALDADRIAQVHFAVELPDGLLDDRDAREAIARGAAGDRLWSRLALGKAAPKALLAAIQFRGAPLKPGDTTGWAAALAHLGVADRERDLGARWKALAREMGAPSGATGLSDLRVVAEGLRLRRAARAALARLPGVEARLSPPDQWMGSPAEGRAVARAVREAAEDARLEGAREAVARVRLLFGGEDRTAGMARRFLDEVVGRPDIAAARVVATWQAIRALLDRLHDRAADFAMVTATTARIVAAGAPAWAARLGREPATESGDPLVLSHWREVWDFAAADAHLARLDARARLLALAAQRGEAERNVTRLFLDLVRERTFYTLERRLSPGVKSALVAFVRALGRLGKGTGRGAGRQRRTAREAMQRCYAAVPCWIMPTWRVSEQLPAELAAFDLVILDEASQSDVTELPAVLRGRKILVVGDDRQVSPGTPFVAQARIDHLRQRYLRGLPFASLLEPGESLYTLMQAVFPDQRLMLKEHFRCVEPIIRFSMQFYPETLVPLRVPAAAERLDPPLVDIFVPHGAREKGRKINPAEAAVIVDEVTAFTRTPGRENRSIGVISLVGGDQAEHIRALLTERLGAEVMQRHAILCGDSATFQGNERDVVFLSMVQDRARRSTLTMQRYEQRFNVAMSRARDRVVLVRSVEPQDLNPADLKARLIAHFAQPMPSLAIEVGADPLERCDSDFERDVMRRLLADGFAVTPQVGALGFRIDLVVEGAGGRRLAVECDGDRFHGPGQWREDMRRQRVLERVGWRFWRCFASSFYADPDGVMAELVDTLARAGIEPRAEGLAEAGPSPWVEHRVARPPAVPEAESAQAELPLAGRDVPQEAASGDRVVLSFADDRKALTLRLTDGPEDLGQGLVAITSPLGQALLRREEDEEVELPLAGGVRKAVVERVERSGAV